MGAHTIGMAEKENSGFDGYWAGEDEDTVFNVTYYEVMIDPTLKWVNEVRSFRIVRSCCNLSAADNFH